MSYVQLIEKVLLPTQVWLTFWDLNEKVQLSLEIGSPKNSYVVGEVFGLDRDAKREQLALQRVDPDEVDSSKLIIPLPSEPQPQSGEKRLVPVAVVTVENGPHKNWQSPTAVWMVE
jgi:hypothetical protein